MSDDVLKTDLGLEVLNACYVNQRTLNCQFLIRIQTVHKYQNIALVKCS